MSQENKPSLLAEILHVKQGEVREKRASRSLAEIRAEAEAMPATRGFFAALEARIRRREPGIIAEIKKASPSRGLIRANLDVAQTARDYEMGGAAAISVLTDRRFFRGEDGYIEAVRAVTGLPLLRKDFIIDPWQVYETRTLGADCLLLIVSALDAERLYSLYELALKVGLEVLVEVHDEQELEVASALGARMIGINNRNLHGFETRLDVTRQLAPKVSQERLVVAESGISSACDIAALSTAGVSAFLVGEALMRADKASEMLQEMIDAGSTT